MSSHRGHKIQEGRPESNYKDKFQAKCDRSEMWGLLTLVVPLQRDISHQRARKNSALVTKVKKIAETKGRGKSHAFD